MAAGRDIEDTEPLRIAELFLVFIVISLLYGRFMHFLNHKLEGPAKRGLRHTVHHIEEELLALGVISLILIVAEDYLIKICVKNDDYDPNYKKKGDSYSSGYRRKLKAGEGDSCDEGDEPFWSAQTMHQTHYFIFMIAIVHVLYATTSFLLCLWRIQRWKRFEKDPELGARILAKKPMMFGRNKFEYWFWSFWAQFSPSVDAALYVSMRSLFIEKMELPEDFNFQLFVLNTMVDDFGVVVHADWMMWLIAAIWILLPKFLLVTSAISTFIILFVGTKLELVGVLLSQQAYLSRSYNHSEGSIKAQPISAPHTILKKPLEMISSKLGTSSRTQLLQDQGPRLGTQSMSMFAHNNSQIPMGVVRRAHSFEEKERPSMDIAPDSHEQVVRFDVQSDPEDVEIHPAAENIKKENDLEKGNVEDLLKPFGNSNVPDSATFFWFGRPRLILKALRFVYFETAMAIALVFFDLWQDSDFILEDSSFNGDNYLLVVILIVVGVLCLLQTSFLMLPTYVLTSVVGSHCPEKVLEQAKKLNIKEEEVTKIEYLRDQSVLSRLDALNKMKKSPHHHSEDDHHNHSHGHGHGSSAATAVLVGAMYKGKVERLKKQESVRFVSPSGSHGATQNPSVRTVIGVEEEEEDEELQAIIKAFGSFENFLAAIRSSQDLIREKCPEAVFNFDGYTGSYHGRQSTNFDSAAINLTLDLNAAAEALDKQTQ